MPRFIKKAPQARNERRSRSTRHARRLIKRVEDGRSENPSPGEFSQCLLQSRDRTNLRYEDSLHWIEKEELSPELPFPISATLPNQVSPTDGGSPAPCSSQCSRASWNALVSFSGHSLLGPPTSEKSVNLSVSENRYPTPPRSESPSRPSFPSPTLTSPSSSLCGPSWSSHIFESTSCPSEPSEQAMAEASNACSFLPFQGPMIREEDIDRYELAYPD